MLFLVAFTALLTSCGGGGASSEVGIPGSLTSTFTDPNEGGRTSGLRLVDVVWGQLVDVHDVDATGEASTDPLFRDLLVRENLLPEGSGYTLTVNPVTQKKRLVIQHDRATDPDLFELVLRDASEPLSPIAARNDDGSSAPPFSFLARNGVLSLRFNDVLDDSAEAAATLSSSVRILTGYPPSTPFPARILFDPHHGAEIDGEFHSTRILIDFTVSALEAADAPTVLTLNSTGLPASRLDRVGPNVSIRIPTRPDFTGGQFAVLRALSGASMTPHPDEPQDLAAPTRDVVRAIRSGNLNDVNGGFVLDLAGPELLGAWPMRVSGAEADPNGTPGFDFLVDVAFTTPCRLDARPGDVLEIGASRFMEVRAPGLLQGDRIVDLAVRSLSSAEVVFPSSLLGGGAFVTTYRTGVPVEAACWYQISPPPQDFPSSGIATDVRVQVRFTEPMDRDSLAPDESFLLVRGNVSTPVSASNTVVGRVLPADDLRAFTFAPELPLDHQEGARETYSIRLAGPRDLAGNPSAGVPPPVDLHLAANEPSIRSGGVMLAFRDEGLDELEPLGATDLRGQFFIDAERGRIRPRPLDITSHAVDRSNPVPSNMSVFPPPAFGPPGLQTPLSPLGSRFQTVWRYADLGWGAMDETQHNLDVVGIHWTPAGGQVVADFFEEFEIALAHSRFLPDEAVSPATRLPIYPASGLRGGPQEFSANLLIDPRSPQKVVHPRPRGFRVNPNELFIGSSGAALMPFPMNRTPGVELTTFTWRDTAVLAKGAPTGNGIPMQIEVGPPLFLETGPAGRYARRGQVPTVGLPLLMEIRTFPSSTAIGLNAFHIALAVNNSALPAFRAYSSGGTNTAGAIVRVRPDEERIPRGGYNPNSTPPGRRTPWSADNAVYFGQLDAVARVSRAHTAWIDTSFEHPIFRAPVALPEPADQPPGTRLVLEYRGATGFRFLPSEAPDGMLPAFDAARMDPYGELFDHDVEGNRIPLGEILYTNDDPTWTTSLEGLSGSRYFQVRISFVGDIPSRTAPELSALGFAFEAR